VTSSKDASTSLLWHEPIERLEFSELFLGGMASTYFARGRPSGYGFCFTDRRIIGFRMRRVSLAVEAPFLGLIGVLYLAVLFEFISGTAVLLGFLLPLILHAANIPITWLTNGISESVLSRRARDTSKLLKRRRDFELRRNQIGELLMKSPGKCPSMLRTGGAGGYLRITPTDYRSKPIEIKVHRWTQHQRLRDLVISFSSREPKVRALEYP
jgi:hypothetical protein